MALPANAQLEETQTENAQPENVQTENAQPENVQTENAQPENVQTENAQPENVQTENAQPENAQTETAAPAPPAEEAAREADRPDTQAAEPQGGSVVVGVSHLPPFAIATKTESGTDWDGIGVHLWREVAEELDISYEWQEISPNEAIDQVENGTIDIAITAAATASAEERVDFTQSYYVTSIGIAQTAQRSILDNVRAVLSPRFLWIVLWLSALLIAVGAIVWLFERRSDEEVFGKGITSGLWDSFWWSAVTMTSVGYGDKVPTTFGGRLVALFWMIVALAVAATLTASITSVLAADDSGQLTQVAMLKQLKVGSVEGSNAAEALKEQDISFQPINVPEDGLNAIADDQIDAFVDDAALLSYINNNNFQRRFVIESTGLQARRYAFALTNDDQQLEAISAQVIQEQTDADWQPLLNQFLPKNN
ncbi:transporter substrate-binding domain-containing protein [cf. Phormidesmis sp. LEGE 11477]|nr:transporter substrate-binding domain-containing protein [cf. Phormidesmis sp. LEGE 11477]